MTVPNITDYSDYETVVLDIEASGLDLDISYPIEIAWCGVGSEDSDCFLINPITANGWEYWDEQAEAIHGLDREQCVNDGISVFEACERLSAQLSGCLVVTDAINTDKTWLKTLFKAANSRPELAFIDIRDYGRQKGQEVAVSNLIAEKKSSAVAHRALDDCLQIVDLGRKNKLFPEA